jgi:nucleoside-triphosphatase
MNTKHILFTGPPRCGKSTLIEKIVITIKTPVTGFITKEILENEKRVGFSIHTMDQKQGLLAHQRIKGRFRVGRYGVNLRDVDRIAVPSMIPRTPDERIIIDEIGKMECFSTLFRNTLMNVLDSDHRVIGSIALKGDRFISRIKAREDVLLVHVSPQNRDSLADLHLRPHSPAG